MTTQSETGNVNYPPPPPPNREKTSNATKAALCGIVPGVGAVYNQDYMKAVVHLAAFSSLCIFAETSGIFGLIAFVFYIYTIFDAYRSALAPGKKNELSSGQMNMPLWGIVLILLGVIFLLDSLDAISLRSVTKFWPLVLVFLGCYLVFQYFIAEKNGRKLPGAGPSAPGPAAEEAPLQTRNTQSDSSQENSPSAGENIPADQQHKDE